MFLECARNNHPCVQLGSTQSLCFLWINNLIGPYTATLLSQWKGYRVCQLGFWKAFYLSLNQMQSKLIIPLSWEWIIILLGMAFEEKVKKHTMELARSWKGRFFSPRAFSKLVILFIINELGEVIAVDFHIEVKNCSYLFKT